MEKWKDEEMKPWKKWKHLKKTSMKNSNSSPKKNQKFLGLRLKSFISTFPKPRKGFRISAFQIIINLKNGKNYKIIYINGKNYKIYKNFTNIKNIFQ